MALCPTCENYADVTEGKCSLCGADRSGAKDTRSAQPRPWILTGGGIAVSLAVLIALSFAVAVLRSSGDSGAVMGSSGESTLDSTVHTAGRGSTNSSVNPGISNLQVTKNETEGSVHVNFDWDESKAFASLTHMKLLVRLFDRNGVYVTHFFGKIWADGSGAAGYKPTGHYEFAYRVNALALREAKRAEVGAAIMDTSDYVNYYHPTLQPSPGEFLQQTKEDERK